MNLQAAYDRRQVQASYAGDAESCNINMLMKQHTVMLGYTAMHLGN